MLSILDDILNLILQMPAVRCFMTYGFMKSEIVFDVSIGPGEHKWRLFEDPFLSVDSIYVINKSHQRYVFSIP